MTLRHLRIFAEVFRQNNISEAARQLHLTQPAVSMAIREMEDFYGLMTDTLISTENSLKLWNLIWNS